MFNRYRSFIRPAGVGLAIALLLAVAWLNGPAPPQVNAGSEGRERSAQAESADPAIERTAFNQTLAEKACAEAEAATDDDGEQHDKRDLCAQFRSAVAAERAARLARWQTIVGGGGLLAVFVTLVLNAAATFAATDQAKTARKHMERLETPFLRAVPVDPPLENVLSKNFKWLRNTLVRLENCGRSYAIVTNWTADTLPFGEWRNRKFDPRRDWGRFVGNALIVPPSGLSIPLGAAPPSTIDEAYRVAEHQGGTLHGIVRYRDALGNRYVMGFAFTYVEHMREYMLLVDPDSNYHYREDEMPYPPV